MKNYKTKTRIKYIIRAYVLISLVFSGMTPILYAGFFGHDDAKTVSELAQKYWNAKLTGDTITCYQLEEPNFRKKTPLSIYARPGNIIFKEVKIDQVDTSDDNATVTVKIKYIIPAFGSKLVFPSTVKDTWKKVDGKWYHVYKSNDLEKRQKIKPKERG